MPHQLILYCNKLIIVCYNCGTVVMTKRYVIRKCLGTITVIKSCLVMRTKSIIAVILFDTITNYFVLCYIMFLVVSKMVMGTSGQIVVLLEMDCRPT